MEINLEKLKGQLDKVVDNTMAGYYGNVAERIEDDLRENIRLMLWEYELQELNN